MSVKLAKVYIESSRTARITIEREALIANGGGGGICLTPYLTMDALEKSNFFKVLREKCFEPKIL